MRLAALAVCSVALAMAAGCGSTSSAEPVSSCGPVVFDGAGKPRLLIVSELPLRAPPGALLQTKGIEYVLRRRHFKAGKYSVGYQSCDDSTAATGARDLARCVANAKAIAADRGVVGIIGPYNSDCAALEIPIANASPNGPLVMIGTATTNPQLTAAAPGNDVGTPAKYYPTKTRNFVRLVGADQYQAAAAALIFRRAHVARVYVLDDGEPYGSEVALWFKQDARRVGVTVAGSATWNPKASDYSSLAHRVARAHPQGVYLAGFVFLHGSLVLKAVRGAVGTRSMFVAPDGFADPAGLQHEVGRAAEGLRYTWAGVPARDAGPEGRQMLKSTGTEPPAQYGALYGAAAASLLLDAIGRSDGSRRSVLRGVFHGSTPPGYLGRITFDAVGDPSVGAMTVFRMTRGSATTEKTVFPTEQLAKGASRSP
jgi:branched-chain amino acid transport system substrate-binding protein